MIEKEAFFGDPYTVNVYTDASVKNHGQVTESIAGIIVSPNNEIYIKIPNMEYSFTRLIPSTNNEGEIYAIYMGIIKCIEIRNAFPNINITFNLFSDSRISILGLREWYFGWIKNTTEMQSSFLINSSGEEVKNQQIFLRCFNAIISAHIHINFYHVRGHMKIDRKSYKIFAKDFKSSNHLNDFPSEELMKQLIYMNNEIDNTSRSLLLPEGKDKNIPTIMGTHKKSSMKDFEGVPIRSEYLFIHDMRNIINNKKRYAALTNHKKKF